MLALQGHQYSSLQLKVVTRFGENKVWRDNSQNVIQYVHHLPQLPVEDA